MIGRKFRMYDKLRAFSTNWRLFAFYRTKKVRMKCEVPLLKVIIVFFGLFPPFILFFFVLLVFAVLSPMLSTQQQKKWMDKTDDSRRCLANYYYHIKFYSCTYKISIFTIRAFSSASSGPHEYFIIVEARKQEKHKKSISTLFTFCAHVRVRSE